MVYVNVAFSYNDAEKSKFVRSANPVCSFVVHPNCVVMVSVQDVPDPSDPRSWRFQLVISWIGLRDDGLNNEEKHAAVKKRAANLPDVQSAVIVNTFTPWLILRTAIPLSSPLDPRRCRNPIL